MAEIQKYSLKEKLQESDEKYMGSLSLLGMTALTFPGYINSMRSTMFTSHLKQFLNLLSPEYPYLFTGAENTVGKHSGGYKKVKDNYTVVKKIIKFDGVVPNPRIYKLFVFNETKQKYEVFTRKEVEDLTEHFGFVYNNDEIDKYEEGDKIKKDTVLYKSTSYDEDMNYAYGKNVTVVYTLDPFTSEDAAVCSESLANEMKSIETEVITIALNHNDYLINLYGYHGDLNELSDEEKENYYKPLPEIGQIVGGHLAAIKRQYNNQLLYDFKTSTLNEIHEGDSVIYCGEDEEILDYTFYNNNEELEDNTFTRQVNSYIRAQDKYYREIYDTCKEIVSSGYDYSQDIEYLYKRSKEMIDTEKKWRESDSGSGDLVIEVTVKKIVPLRKGQKITPRMGNKSVVSRVLADEEMPFTEDGRRIDLMLNLLAIINRTTYAPLFEILLTSMAYQVRQRIKNTDDIKQREKLLFGFLHEVNEQQEKETFDMYLKLDKEGKEDFFDSVINDGIYMNQTPLWETKPIFYRLKDLLEKYKWLQPTNIYINKWGRKIKCLNKYWVGDLYVLKLKQTDRKGYSARSTGAVDLKGLPVRNYKARTHLEQTSGTAIRFNKIIGVEILLLKIIFSKTFLTAGTL